MPFRKQKRKTKWKVKGKVYNIPKWRGLPQNPPFLSFVSGLSLKRVIRYHLQLVIEFLIVYSVIKLSVSDWLESYKHRKFLSYGKRKLRSSRIGYGSHSFLNEYIYKNKCKRIMEIGVADGENARNMMEVAIRNFLPEEVEYYGFDLFGGTDDSRLKQVRQKLKEARCEFILFKGDSVETLPKAVKTLPKMDMIFIDGGHSYATVKSDWENSKFLMHNETAAFFHNYDFSGPKKVVNNISRQEYQVKIIHPTSDYDTALVKKKV